MYRHETMSPEDWQSWVRQCIRTESIPEDEPVAVKNHIAAAIVKHRQWVDDWNRSWPRAPLDPWPDANNPLRR